MESEQGKFGNSPVARREQLRLEHANEFRREMGLPELSFNEESQMPPVNVDLLTALAKGEIDGAEADDLYRLVDQFRSWNRAYTQALLAAVTHRR